MHCFFGSRNSPTTGILHTFCHVYRSVCPAREAKLWFGAALECSVHDCKNCLLPTYQRGRKSDDMVIYTYTKRGYYLRL